jgi:hypothetical protein
MMDKSRKKALTAQYKQTLPPMGAYQIRCLAEPKVYVGIGKNLKGKMTGDMFKLNSGGHVNRALQTAWNLYGGDQFAMEVLEELAEDSQDLQKDYSEELELLKTLWEEKLTQENLRLYGQD